MILKNIQNILIALTIAKVNAFYPFGPKEFVDQARNNDCFKIGENGTNNSICKKFEGYYIPRNNVYSEYMSFSDWVTHHIINDNELSQHLASDGCNGSVSSLKNREDILCSYLVYDSILNNRCQQEKKTNPPYVCNNVCADYSKSLKNICPQSSYSKVGVSLIENACNNFKICKTETSNVNNNTNTGFNNVNNNINSNGNNNNNKNSNINNNNNPSITNTLGNSNSTISSADSNTINGISTNNGEQNNNSNSNNQNSGNDNSARNNNGGGNINNEVNNNSLKNSNNNDNPNGGPNRNILYTVGFMVPMSLFIGIGVFYYRRKNNKSYVLEKENYSFNRSSNHSSTQNMSEHSFSSSGNSNVNGHNKVFSIGFTDPKNVSINIPITNKNIDSREQDTLARNRVAELISTATMINAANNGYNNIQPISPNEVNININTTSRFNTLNSNTSNSSLNNSYNRKLPSYVINKTDDNSSLNVNINKQSNSLKVQLPTHLNTMSPTSPESEMSPIVDLSMSENDPLLNVKKSNSFYHSSVSSESKKYNSFISPISPIMTERSYENKNSNSNVNYKDGINKENQYTNHLLTKSILEENRIIEDDEENQNNGNENKFNDIDIEGNELLEVENSDLRPSKIFSTDISDINKVETNSSRINNGVSITVDDVDSSSRSSKYTSAKIPLSVMTVVQEFEPRMEDELKLEINDRILLLKVFDDGWAVGLNQMTGKQGVFPMEYVVSSELIKSTNKFASQIEFRNVLPNRTQSQAFANFSFTSTTINDSVIHLTDSDFDVSTMSKTQSIGSSKYYAKNSMVDVLRKSKLNTQSIIEEE
ncbi:hypothetical protein BCR32DRAFT_328235 [Anaeromyces robustus]|uniref:SH3 domain-containing protein n=1 Tax=Anaeromyces robustus TaxID=1754192 RepID=A0A1Y1X195_9FUNG|nr:hypothetical protein BCR32DRAFT_328235 [Anaeromyces robustus]|eukprot:ORX79186.1 hypothetical protein BCR32DRAFT_328235 [Anaeromyces robustus]